MTFLPVPPTSPPQGVQDFQQSEAATDTPSLPSGLMGKPAQEKTSPLSCSAHCVARWDGRDFAKGIHCLSARRP